MIVPLIAAAAALLLLGGAAASSSPESLRRKLTRKFSRNTLEGTGTPGLYNVKMIPNTTPALTHIANALYKEGVAAVFTNPEGGLVYMSSDGNPPRVGQWILYASPGLIHR